MQDVQEKTDYVSYEAFLAFSDEMHAEWVEGKVFPMSPPSDRHQDIVRFLTSILSHFAEAYDLGVVRPAPFQMKVTPDGSGREPDILFIAKENLGRLKTNRLEGPADLVIEIISPESRARDRGEKFYEYEAGGVKEYWLIDPDREQAEFYQLDARGKHLCKRHCGSLLPHVPATAHYIQLESSQELIPEYLSISS